MMGTEGKGIITTIIREEAAISITTAMGMEAEGVEEEGTTITRIRAIEETGMVTSISLTEEASMALIEEGRRVMKLSIKKEGSLQITLGQEANLSLDGVGPSNSRKVCLLIRLWLDTRAERIPMEILWIQSRPTSLKGIRPEVRRDQGSTTIRDRTIIIEDREVKQSFSRKFEFL